jgi:Ras GTPase-activating-like protein IQGAP2/3
MRIVQAPELDLCTDPVEVSLSTIMVFDEADGQLYHRSINAEETQSGMASTRPRNLDADQVLQTDAHARAEYIQRRFSEMKAFLSLTARPARTAFLVC